MTFSNNTEAHTVEHIERIIIDHGAVNVRHMTVSLFNTEGLINTYNIHTLSDYVAL